MRRNCPGSRGMAALLVVSALCVIESAATGADEPTAPRKPNVVVIVSDDQGFADVGFHGCTDIPTPNLDALAARGVRCSNGYVSGPYCSPTRAGFLTGRYQQRFGHEFNPGDSNREGEAIGLPVSETTIADRLKSAGYATGIVGKWHLGTAPKYHPQRRGFDEFFGFLGGAHPYFPGKGAPIFRGTEAVDEKEYLTDAFAREAVAFVERHQESPFFLYLSFKRRPIPRCTPTTSGSPKFKAIADVKRRQYAAMLTALDDGVGEVLATIRDNGLERDTLVVLFQRQRRPDDGRHHDQRLAQRPVPGLEAYHPRRRHPRPVRRELAGGRSRRGTVYDQPVIQLDVLPTALAAAGVDIDPSWKLDGVDLLPYLEGDPSAPPHDALFWRLGPQNAIRKGDWKVVQYDRTVDEPGERSRGASGIPVTAPRLYDLKADPGESHDLAAEQTRHAPRTARRLAGLGRRTRRAALGRDASGRRQALSRASARRPTEVVRRPNWVRSATARPLGPSPAWGDWVRSVIVNLNPDRL